jgi:ACT domain-containing protein
MANNKPIPKTQLEIAQSFVDPLLNTGKSPSVDNKRRELQKTVKNDDVKQFSLGLKDIDETIFYYFTKVIRPTVIQNGLKKEVPLLYGSPERWAAVQKDGFYRDKGGKIQAPLIMFKRDSVEKNRSYGNKLDANNPLNYGIFQKSFSKKNMYDRFSLLNNRDEVKEYYAVIMPDFVDITYSCIIFTDYVEQMNKLVESINFASDSYWGDPEKFSFRAMIDSYAQTTELATGSDRTVKTTFTIKLLGHIVPDSINATVKGMNKFYSKSAVNFGFEMVSNIETQTTTQAVKGKARFYDKASETLNLTTIEESMTSEQKTYVTLQKVITSNTINTTVNAGARTLTFTGQQLVEAPAGFPALTKANFQVFINGMIVETDAIDSIQEVGGNLVVTFNSTLGFAIASTDEYTLIGKLV